MGLVVEGKADTSLQQAIEQKIAVSDILVQAQL